MRVGAVEGRGGAADGRGSAFLCLLGGAVAGTGQVPLALSGVAFVAFALLIWIVASAPRGRRAAWRGWLAGFGYFAATLFWIIEPFLVDAARTAWMAPFALVFMAGGMALFWGGAAWLGYILGGTRAGRAAGFALALALMGLIRGYALTGFPWALPAYIWTQTPVIQLVAWTGPYGLGLLTLLAAALPAMARGRIRVALFAGVSVALVAAGWLAGAVRLAGEVPAPMDLRVRLIQPNAAQELKWRPDMVPVFYKRNLALTAAPAEVAPDLVIWPETSVPWMLDAVGPAFDEMRAAAGPDAALIFGIQRRDAAGFYNSLVVMAGPGTTPSAIYDKHHLVPFGEFVPYADLLPSLGLAGLAAQIGGGYQRGSGPRVIDIAGRGRALPLICYEAVFPQDIYRAYGAGERPDYLLHITNDAWFGNLAGPYQHLAQARVRAIEQGLPMLRAANTGVSAVIDARGRVLVSLELGVAGKIDAMVPGALAPTFYSRWREAPVLGVVLLAFLVLGWRRLRQLSR